MIRFYLEKIHILDIFIIFSFVQNRANLHKWKIMLIVLFKFDFVRIWSKIRNSSVRSIFVGHFGYESRISVDVISDSLQSAVGK